MHYLVQGVDGSTVLRHAVTVAGNYAIIRLLLNSLTESERVQAVNMTDNDGSTVLQLTKSSSTRNFIRKLVASHASSCTFLCYVTNQPVAVGHLVDQTLESCEL